MSEACVLIQFFNMTEIVPDALDGGLVVAATTEPNGIIINNPIQNNGSPKSSLRPRIDGIVQEEVHAGNEANPVHASIDQLCDNVCDMQSSDQSPSRHSFTSDSDESQIDSELRHLVGGEMREVEIMEEEVAGNSENDTRSDSKSNQKGSASIDKKSGKTQSIIGKLYKEGPSDQRKLDSEMSVKSTPKKIITPGKTNGQNGLSSSRGSAGSTPVRKQKNNQLSGAVSAFNNPDLGPFLLMQARDLISSGDDLHKALNLALRAANSFEICVNGKPSLDHVMSLHVTAAIYCSLGQYTEAIPILEKSLGISSFGEGQDHALAKFAGYMQLGDTYAILGLLEDSILCYKRGLKVQKQNLGEKDPRVGQTCRYLAEAHVQAMQLEEAQKICEQMLEIHRENGSPASLEEAADRRLMGLICEINGDHEAALEHLVLASMSLVANGQESEVASVDCSIGDAYLSLSRFEEAIFSYQKALTAFKSTKGETHPAVASVYVRLAELCSKTGKLRDSKSYCENALQIYMKPAPGTLPEEIAAGFTDISAIYESMNELDQAINLLQEALNIYLDAPGQQNMVAGIESQMGVMYYVLGNYGESYNSFKKAISKLRASNEKQSAFFALALNQMGLACVQRYAINEAAQLFEEARSILEQEYGPYHPDTIGVYSNLAATYDAVGRLNDAIEILEFVVAMREEKLGTANPDVDDEKRRLGELLKEAGKVRGRKASSLGTLLRANLQTISSNNSVRM